MCCAHGVVDTEKVVTMFMMTYEVRVWAARLETWLAAAAAHLALGSLRRDTSLHVSSPSWHLGIILPCMLSHENIAKVGTAAWFLTEDGRN